MKYVGLTDNPSRRKIEHEIPLIGGKDHLQLKVKLGSGKKRCLLNPDIPEEQVEMDGDTVIRIQ